MVELSSKPAPNASAKWVGYPNLRRRPPAPPAGRGRMQRAVPLPAPEIIEAANG
jgi:hypothetical protein